MPVTTGGVALTGDSALAIKAAPAPVVVTQTPGDWWFYLWPGPGWGTPPKAPKTTVTGGVTGSHASIGRAALTVSKYQGSGSGGHALGLSRLAITNGRSAVGHAALYGVSKLSIVAPVTPGSTPNELVYFPVSGTWYDVESPDLSGVTNHPLLQIISGYVTFYPRVPAGFTALIENLDTGSGVGNNTAVSLAPIQCRIMHGQLSTINRPDTPGVQLLSNTALMQKALQTIDAKWLKDNNLAPGLLVYDVKFSNVVFAAAPQTVSNFGFLASPDTTEICLTDPGVTRIPYGGPN